MTASPLQNSCIFFIDAKENTEVFWKYFCFTLKMYFWSLNYNASSFPFGRIFSLQQHAFSIQQLLTLLMANQSWSLATGASASCERFLSSKKNYLFPPILPSGQVLTASWKRALCLYSGPEIFPELAQHLILPVTGVFWEVRTGLVTPRPQHCAQSSLCTP